MARIKNLPPSRAPQNAKLRSPPATAKAAWSAAIELGASNDQAMEKKPGGAWELVRWAQGIGASSIGGAEAIPAMTAIRKGGHPKEILHGHDAVRARKRNPNDWEMFAYPKLVFMEEAMTPNIKRALELQKEKAAALGMTPQDIAIAFFRHVIGEVIGEKEEICKIHINISDRWPNRNVQELMMSLQGSRAKVTFEHVDECLSSIIGRIPGDESGVYVVVDCGHSGMVRFKQNHVSELSDSLQNAGFAEVAPGPKYKVHHWKDYHAGAGEINMAVEDAVRAINRANGTKSAEANVWEVSECIDEFFKPEPEAKISPRCGLSEGEWDEVMGHAALANRNLDRRRASLVRPILAEALNLAERLGDDIGFHVLLTGRGSRSPTLLKAFRNLIEQDFPTAILHEDKRSKMYVSSQIASETVANSYDSTAVLEGLMRIADEPDILSVKEVPVSLWMRSDPDEHPDGNASDTVVRICTQGRDINDKNSVRDRVSASHPVHLELCATDDEAPSLDLSVFGTPAGVSDDDIVQGWNAENFAYTQVDKVTEFGRFERQLPRSTVKPGKSVCHVYLYMEVARLSVAFYAIFAKDGRAVKPLEKVPFDKVLQDGELTTKWKKYQNIELNMVRLKQVARPETLSTRSPQHSSSKDLPLSDSGAVLPPGSQRVEVSHSRDVSVARSQQGEVTYRDVSRSNSIAARRKEDETGGSGRNRTSSLLKGDKRKRRNMSSLAATRKRMAPDKARSERDSTNSEGAESEMEM